MTQDAFGTLSRRAVAGDSTAEHELSDFYWGFHASGQGGLTKRLSMYWLRRAASHGQIDAKHTLGIRTIYLARGESEPIKEGLRLIQEAADAGLLAAFRTLGQFHASGQLNDGNQYPALLVRDTQIAQQWYERSALMGDVIAQYELATLLMKSPDPDLDKIHYWLDRAIAQDYALAMKDKGILMLTSSRVRSRDRIKDALAFLERGAEHGVGQELLGLICEGAHVDGCRRNNQIPRSIPNAASHYKGAIRNGTATCYAYQRLSKIYYYGETNDYGRAILPVDFQKAYYWWRMGHAETSAIGTDEGYPKYSEYQNSDYAPPSRVVQSPLVSPQL